MRLCMIVGCRIVRGKKTRLQCSSWFREFHWGRGVLCCVLCPDDAEIFNLLSLESDTKDNTQGNKDWYVETLKMLVIVFILSFFSSLGHCFVNPGIGFSLPIDIQVPSLGKSHTIINQQDFITSKGSCKKLFLLQVTEATCHQFTRFRQKMSTAGTLTARPKVTSNTRVTATNPLSATRARWPLSSLTATSRASPTSSTSGTQGARASRHYSTETPSTRSRCTVTPTSTAAPPTAPRPAPHPDSHPRVLCWQTTLWSTRSRSYRLLTTRLMRKWSLSMLTTT